METPPLPLDATPRELAATVEGNLYALFRQISALPGAEIVESPRLAMHSAPFANPMFRGVWRTRLEAGDADDVIEQALAWFRERRAPFVFWWTGPETSPDDLSAKLAERGFVAWEENAPGMIAPIAALDADALKRTPDNLVVTAVDDEAGLETFAAELIAAFGMPDWAARSWAEATRAAGIGRTPWRLYLARVGGQPVGTAMLVTGGGVAGVMAIGVREAWRGRGIGAALTLKPLLEAQADGYHHAALFATPLGQPVYARLGFRECHAPISRYLWRNPVE